MPVTTPTSHYLDIYDCWLHVTTNARQLATLRRKYPQIPKRDDGAFGGTISFRESPTDACDVNHYVIDLDIKAHRGNQGELLNTVAHEAAHTSCHILDAAGAGYDGDSEPLAWLVGWVVRWVWEQVA